MDYTNQLSESFGNVNITHHLWIILGVLILIIRNYAGDKIKEYAFHFALLIFVVNWVIPFEIVKRSILCHFM